jgi:hypothetical protein
LQEDDKKTVAAFFGSQQKLGRSFKKDARDGILGGCPWHKGKIGEDLSYLFKRG